MSYEDLMLHAITQANKYKFTAKPNPVVGAILVHRNKIISEGYHEKYGSNHAEINAINNAKIHLGNKFNSFSELTLICTLEPCSHIGKTGSCAHAIVKTGIKKVIIGAIDPNPKVSGKGVEILKKNNIDVEIGIHKNLVARQNKFFFFRHENNRPYITVKIASSADGKSHYKNNKKEFITTKDSRIDVQHHRAEYDAILTGKNTLLNDNPRMNARVDFKVNQPEKILLSNSYKKTDNTKALQFFEGSKTTHIKTNSLDKVMSVISDSDICSIFVEAGPKLVNSFLEKYADELIIYTSTKILGESGVDWFAKDNAIENYNFTLKSSCKIGTDLKQVFYKNEKK